MPRSCNIEVPVHGNFEKFLRGFKKKIEREGVIRDMKKKDYFEPPTQQRRKKFLRAVKKAFYENAENLYWS